MVLPDLAVVCQNSLAAGFGNLPALFNGIIVLKNPKIMKHTQCIIFWGSSKTHKFDTYSSSFAVLPLLFLLTVPLPECTSFVELKATKVKTRK